uniref:Uncharacterized protein n=1 Tax=Panagrolaimus sp. ES5 TaxID=591445 RepID=A0AC34GCW2_9BILA
MFTQWYFNEKWKDIKKSIVEKFEVQPPTIAAAEESDDEPDAQNLSSLKDEGDLYAKEKNLPPPKPNEKTTDMAFEFWIEK